MLDFLWDIRQQRQIADAGAEAASAQRDAQSALDNSAELERRIEALTLTCEALWEICRDRLGVSREELFAKVEEVDLRDGKRDGKIGIRAVSCPKCQRRTSSARRNCVYCGITLPVGAAFRKET